MRIRNCLDYQAKDDTISLAGKSEGGTVNLVFPMCITVSDPVLLKCRKYVLAVWSVIGRKM